MADDAHCMIFPPSWSYQSLKNTCPLTPSVQAHLKSVYLTLCIAIGVSAAGAYAQALWDVGGNWSYLLWTVFIVWLQTAPVCHEKLRMGLLMAAAALEGVIFGPLINLALASDASLLITTFGGTALVFACFSLAALVAQRRRFLYLGGLLGSGISILLWSRFVSVTFGDSVAMYNLRIYFGLLVFIVYIVLDTQMIVECAFQGDLDYIGHALQLYTDFIAIFVRIFRIMAKNDDDDTGDGGGTE